MDNLLVIVLLGAIAILLIVMNLGNSESIINTIVGGLIGYLSRGYKDGRLN